jgi:hypothetical protein
VVRRWLLGKDNSTAAYQYVVVCDVWKKTTAGVCNVLEALQYIHRQLHVLPVAPDLEAHVNRAGTAR